MGWSLFGFVFLAGCLTGSAYAQDSFGYNQNSELGPERWADQYQSCGGKYQSPIDIEESLVSRVSLNPLKFDGVNRLQNSSILTNTGHTVLLKINNTQPILISGGPLTGDYTFEQLHFHWGINDSLGSEDTINNKSYSMELHMVFFKSSYGSLENAMNYKDGLAVIASFFEISEQNNTDYSELVDSLSKVEWPNSKVDLHHQFTLERMLPKNRNNYFTYNGSLTTPPCLEVVTWIDFKHSVRLSHEQLESFRRLRSQEGFMTHNSRPVQPLHGRPILYNIGRPFNPNSNNNGASSVNIKLAEWVVIISLNLFVLVS